MRLYLPYKIKSATDTPPERVAHSHQRTPARQSPTRLGPGRNDLFRARVETAFVARVWAVMARTPQHTYQVLTKRPERLARVLAAAQEELRLPRWPLPNVWLGTSVESDDRVRRADHLRAAPAGTRFLSLEPLLGPLPSLDLTGIDWLIVGGESGPVRRPVDPEWVRDLRDRAVGHGVPFFFKLLCTNSGTVLGASSPELAGSGGPFVGCVGIDQIVEADRDGCWFAQLACAGGRRKSADGYEVDEGAPPAWSCTCDGDDGAQRNAGAVASPGGARAAGSCSREVMASLW
jgi:protein gp37